MTLLVVSVILCLTLIVVRRFVDVQTRRNIAFLFKALLALAALVAVWALFLAACRAA